jgi:hypothetical protein
MLRTAFPAWQLDILNRLGMPQVQRNSENTA